MKDLITTSESLEQEDRMIARFKMYQSFFDRDVVEKMALDSLSIYGYAKWTIETQLSSEQMERLNEIKSNRTRSAV